MSEEISKAKQKRLKQTQNRRDQKAKKAMVTFWSIAIPLMLILAVVLAIVVYQRSRLDYSRYLTNEGKISNIKTADFVSVDYESISFNKVDLLPSDETVESDIAYALSSHAELSDDAALTAKDGDRIQISFTATSGGEIVTSATEAEGGQAITIGNEEYTAALDEALTGHHPGDDLMATITFPDDFSNASLAGKTADFDVHLSGIYVTPEFNDAFVTTYYADTAATAAGYRQSIIDNYYESNLKQAISDAIKEKSTVSSYPANYRDNLKKVMAEQDLQQMEYYNQMYMQYSGSPVYNNAYELYGFTTQAEYDASLEERVNSGVEDALELQYIYEKAGLSNPESDVRAYYTEMGYDDASFAKLQEQYGFGYLAQSVLSDKVLDYLMETVPVTETVTIVD